MGINAKLEDQEEAWDIFRTKILTIAEEICGNMNQGIKEKRSRWKEYKGFSSNENYLDCKNQQIKVTNAVREAEKTGCGKFGQFLHGNFF
ncbi:hypothetical protein CWI39_0182p0010 [Hamiltosporidium magnivora]|uniref:Uncharacterized protein n=1 Tax=Hamiltosporidium magnivora TaxID=148818 RepID=A0A4V2JWL5_9MICR|nr:hypothetical protein CWI39_0182p0010 [Hamiltosporidium magnivora]